MNRRFAKNERLLKRREFVRVQRSGARFRTARFVVLALARDDEHTRIGITTSRKVGNAPERNSVRRRLREAYRLHKNCWPTGVDFVVIARSNAVNADHEEYVSDLKAWASWWNQRQQNNTTA